MTPFQLPQTIGGNFGQAEDRLPYQALPVQAGMTGRNGFGTADFGGADSSVRRAYNAASQNLERRTPMERPSSGIGNGVAIRGRSQPNVTEADRLPYQAMPVQAGVTGSNGFNMRGPEGTRSDGRVLAQNNMQPNQPLTGVRGAEQALQQGAFGAVGATMEGMQQARQDLISGGQGATDQLGRSQGMINDGVNQGVGFINQGDRRSQNLLSGGLNSAQNQLSGAVRSINQGVGQSVGQITQGSNQSQGMLNRTNSQSQGMLNQAIGETNRGAQQGVSFLNDLFQQAVDPVSGFIDPGQQAQIIQGSLTGVFGPEAQREAIANFSNDPAAAFALEEAERSTTRNAAAIGGLGGGRVRQELQRQAQGIQNQQFNTRVDQLGRQAATGLNAANTVAGLRSQQGQVGAGILNQAGRDNSATRQFGAGLNAEIGGRIADINRDASRDRSSLIQQGSQSNADLQRIGAGLTADVSSEQARVATQSAANIAEIIQSGSLQGANIGQISAQVLQQTGQDLAQLSQSTGLNVANIVQDLGSNSAQVRTQAGRDLSAAIANASTNLSNLQNEQGRGISDVVGGQVGNISNLLLAEGTAGAEANRQLAVLLANISTGQGSNAGNIAANIGRIEAAGILGTSRSVQTAIGSLSDMLGERNTNVRQK